MDDPMMEAVRQAISDLDPVNYHDDDAERFLRAIADKGFGVGPVVVSRLRQVEPDLARMKALHGVLREMQDALLRVKEAGLPDGIGSDTAFAIGEAAGVLSRAKGLVGRDVDDAGRSSSAGAVPGAVPGASTTR